MMDRATFGCLALIGLIAGCAPMPASRQHTAPVAASDVSPSGRMHGYVTARRHSDFNLAGGKESRTEVEYGWDYDRAVGLRKTFDTQGKLLQTEQISAANIPLTAVEAERVRALVRGQPALKPIVNKPDVVIWGEGFAFGQTNDPYCDLGSRCVHAIAAADFGDTAVAHAIVDLQSDRVVYPFYHPSESDPIKIYGE